MVRLQALYAAAILDLILMFSIQLTKFICCCRWCHCGSVVFIFVTCFSTEKVKIYTLISSSYIYIQSKKIIYLHFKCIYYLAEIMDLWSFLFNPASQIKKESTQSLKCNESYSVVAQLHLEKTQLGHGCFIISVETKKPHQILPGIMKKEKLKSILLKVWIKI